MICQRKRESNIAVWIIRVQAAQRLSTDRRGVVQCCSTTCTIRVTSHERHNHRQLDCLFNGIVFNTWRAHRMSFSGFIFSRMETTYLIVNICLCYISDVVSKSVMRRRHLISNIKFSADWSPLAHDPRIFSLMKIRFGSWPDVVKHYPDSKVHGPTWGPPGSCRPQMGPMLAPWTLLSG